MLWKGSAAAGAEGGRMGAEGRGVEGGEGEGERGPLRKTRRVVVDTIG